MFSINRQIKYSLVWKIVFVMLLYSISILLSAKYNYLVSGILIISGVILYFYLSTDKEKNYLNSEALFSGIWLFTIGLAQLRIMEYQVIWNHRTWVVLGLAHISFFIGIEFSKKINSCLNNSKDMTKLQNYFHYSTDNAEILFKITICTQCIGIIIFMIHILSKGYIPMLESHNNQRAYHSFYSRLVVLYVASYVSGGMSVFLIKKSVISKKRKIWLGINSFFIVFVIPVITVQRGQFLTAALIVVAFVYLLSDKKFIIVVLSLIIMLGTYQLGSTLRGYTNDQFKNLFPVKERTDSEDSLAQIDRDDVVNQIVFTYTYFTVSHDNFDSAVTNSEVRTNGVLQAKPFSVILRFPQLRKSIADAEVEIKKFFVKPYFNTYNLIGYFYFDFGIFGVIVLMILWSFIFGIFEKLAVMSENPFFITLYGIFLIPVFFCFFSSWMSNFTIWLYCGTTMLMFLGYKYLVFRKEKNMQIHQISERG